MGRPAGAEREQPGPQLFIAPSPHLLGHSGTRQVPPRRGSKALGLGYPRGQNSREDRKRKIPPPSSWVPVWGRAHGPTHRWGSGAHKASPRQGLLGWPPRVLRAFLQVWSLQSLHPWGLLPNLQRPPALKLLLSVLPVHSIHFLLSKGVTTWRGT